MGRLIRNLALLLIAVTSLTSSYAGLLRNLLPKPSTVIGVATIGAAIYATKHCTKVKDSDTGQSKIVCQSLNIIKSDSAEQEEQPSLIDEDGKKHILDGDGPNSGGGHRAGTGKIGKSEFPADWSDAKIEGEISDIATDPSISWSDPDARGYVQGVGIRDGVEIKVVKNTKSGRIVTGYPLNLGRNK